MLRTVLSVVSVLVLLSGCAARSARDAVPEGGAQSGVRAESEVSVTVSRQELRDILRQRPLLNTVRLVRTTPRSDSSEGMLPEYRLFDIKRGGAYALIGLQNADVLVAVHDYVVYEPERFMQYIRLLPDEPGPSSLLLRRSGISTRLSIQLVN